MEAKRSTAGTELVAAESRLESAQKQLGEIVENSRKANQEFQNVSEEVSRLKLERQQLQEKVRVLTEQREGLIQAVEPLESSKKTLQDTQAQIVAQQLESNQLAQSLNRLREDYQAARKVLDEARAETARRTAERDQISAVQVELSALQKQKANLIADISKLNQDVSTAKVEQKTAKEKEDSARADAIKAEAQALAVREQWGKLDKDRSDLQQAIAGLSGQKKSFEEQLNQDRETLAKERSNLAAIEKRAKEVGGEVAKLEARRDAAIQDMTAKEDLSGAVRSLTEEKIRLQGEVADLQKQRELAERAFGAAAKSSTDQLVKLAQEVSRVLEKLRSQALPEGKSSSPETPGPPAVGPKEGQP